eukprot:1161608-Pelagomonas_calceolata.AAC.11
MDKSENNVLICLILTGAYPGAGEGTVVGDAYTHWTASLACADALLGATQQDNASHTLQISSWRSFRNTMAPLCSVVMVDYNTLLVCDKSCYKAAARDGVALALVHNSANGTTGSSKGWVTLALVHKNSSVAGTPAGVKDSSLGAGANGARPFSGPGEDGNYGRCIAELKRRCDEPTRVACRRVGDC